MASLSQLTDKDLANSIITLVTDATTMPGNWGFYLFSTDLHEPELKNRIGTIWIIGLLDSLEAEERILLAHKEEARKRRFKNMVAWCERAEELYLFTKDVLSLYTKEEQLFLEDYRNQLVHTRRNKIHNEKFNVRYFDGAKFITEPITKAEYNDSIRPFYMSGLDLNLSELIGRFVNAELMYWSALNTLRNDAYVAEALTAIYDEVGAAYKSGPDKTWSDFSRAKEELREFYNEGKTRIPPDLGLTE